MKGFKVKNFKKMLFVALDILELSQKETSFLLEQPRNYKDLTEGLDRFKNLVKKQRKKLARKYHPDMPKGNEEKMKQINDAVDFIMNLKAIRRQPAPVHFSFSATMDMSTTNTTVTSFRTFFYDL